jgi:hypothetical protein
VPHLGAADVVRWGPDPGPVESTEAGRKQVVGVEQWAEIRHHLVATTSLVAADGGDTRGAVRR